VSVVQPDATDRTNLLLDSAGEPVAVNCRQRRARHHCLNAFPQVTGALGGTRTPNLLIRRRLRVIRLVSAVTAYTYLAGNSCQSAGRTGTR
jgi:hypothetical protein